MATFRDGDWYCPSCSNHNFASRETCNKCQATKNGGASYGAVVKPAVPPRSAPYGGAAYAAATYNGYAAAPPPAAPGGADVRPGDWMCPSCSNHNFASRMVCKQCSVPKPGQQGYGQQMGQGYGQQMGYGMQYGQPHQGGYQMGAPSGMVYPYAGGGKGKGQAAPHAAGAGASSMRPGDWMCPVCSNHNFASRENCNKCKVPKGTQIAKTGYRQGDWLCAACNNHNFASRETCNRCQAAAPAPAVA